MLKPVSEVIKDFMALWPDMEEPWIYDKGLFYCPSENVIRRALEASSVPTMEIIDEFNDCDDIALQFIAEFRRKQYFAWKAGNLPKEFRYPSATGIVFGDKFRGVEGPHQVCAVDGEEDVFIVDAYPNIKRVWKADPANDNVIKLAYM
jgi:hypothetical protein